MIEYSYNGGFTIQREPYQSMLKSIVSLCILARLKKWGGVWTDYSLLRAPIFSGDLDLGYVHSRY
jgi:hypothetical protein